MSQPNECYRCKAPLTPLSDIELGELLDMEQTYREQFPNTWDMDQSKGNLARVRVCDDCFAEMDEEQSPEQFEIEQMLKGDDDE